MLIAMRLLTLAFTLAVATAALTVAQTPPPPPGGGRRQPPPPPKNLKILPPEGIFPVMQGYRTSLGVQCQHCHVQGDFASDDNPKKEIARSMITMVKEINAKMPEGKSVSCFTCHRGAVEPVSAIPAPAPQAPRPPQP